MKAKQLLLLIVVAAALFGLTTLTKKRNAASADALTGTPLLPNLDLNRIAAVEITDAGTTLRLARSDDRWVLTNAYHYPADFARLSQRLIALRDIKIGQVQRGMTLDGDAATRVTFHDSAGATLASLSLGAGRQARGSDDDQMRYYRGHDGRYVTRNDDATVLLLKESLDDWTTANDNWIDSHLTSIAASDIETITLGPATNATAVTLDRSAGSLTLTDLDPDNEINNSSRLSGVDTALSYLRFIEVADPALTPAELGFTTGHFYRATLKSGEIYTVQLGNKHNTGRYLHIEASLPPATTNDAARVAAEAKIAEINAKLQPWNFLISTYSADNMIRTRAELVSPKPVETNEVEEVAADLPDEVTAEPAAEEAEVAVLPDDEA